ncbi:MAG: hypothetical protein V7745_05345 [Pseudomonadales bacterium]
MSVGFLKQLARSVYPLFIFCFVSGLALLPSTLRAMPVFINELHYDNAGADIDEGVELAGLAGTNLQGWRLWFYNGSTGQSYVSLALSGVFEDQQNGYGVLGFTLAGIQNGAPDGIALVDGAGLVQQFISYEGVFAGLGGVADNLLSEDIGVAESSATAIGTSLQLTGGGSSGFLWRSGVSSFGAVNALQQFATQRVVQSSVMNAPTWGLLVLGLLGLVLRRVDEQEVVAL